MIDPESHEVLKQAISERIEADKNILAELRSEARPLRSNVRRIQPRTTTSISLVATDGGNNKLQFDPFLVQLVRVVDSSNNEYCLDAISPTTDVISLSAVQFRADGTGKSALGRMMADLGVSSLAQLSPVIQDNSDRGPISPSWVQVYRELVEWAILYDIVKRKEFGSDTLVVFDGLLRSKVFASRMRDGKSVGLFSDYLSLMKEAIEKQWQKSRRRIYLVGVAKHSKVLARYRLAFQLERVMTTDYPAYVEVPREMEQNAYVWSEYARGDDQVIQGGEMNKYVGGKMFLVKFGAGRFDPIWPIDVFSPQAGQAQAILGFLLADAVQGFPVPHYPRCLQKAHENAALVDFDFDILQDEIIEAMRSALGLDAPVLDAFRLQDSDPAGVRYG